jgi:hypothetical protein
MVYRYPSRFVGKEFKTFSLREEVKKLGEIPGTEGIDKKFFRSKPVETPQAAKPIIKKILKDISFIQKKFDAKIPPVQFTPNEKRIGTFHHGHMGVDIKTAESFQRETDLGKKWKIVSNGWIFFLYHIDEPTIEQVLSIYRIRKSVQLPKDRNVYSTLKTNPAVVHPVKPSGAYSVRGFTELAESLKKEKPGLLLPKLEEVVEFYFRRPEKEAEHNYKLDNGSSLEIVWENQPPYRDPNEPCRFTSDVYRFV